MPSGNVPLLTAAKYGKDQVAQGVIKTMIRESPILESLPWLSFSGNALRRDVEGTLPDVQFRNVNEGYTASHGSNDATFWGVAILGGEYKVDKFLTNVVDNEKDIEADQIEKLSKSNAMRFDFEFFEGTGANKGFKGIKQLIAEGHGQEYDNNGAGALSLDGLDQAIDMFRGQGKPDAALVNRFHRRKITNLARTTVTGVSLIDVGTDVFGRKVNMYDDIPLRIVGDVRNASGQTVPGLPFTEGSSTSSIYFTRFGKDEVCGLLGMGGSLTVQRFGELQAAPQRMGRLEWYPGVAVFDKYAIVRYSNITES